MQADSAGDPIDKNHYINSHDGRFDSTTREDLNNLMAKIAAQPPDKRIVVHFHGGLVDEKAGMDIAGNLVTKYQSVGAYPVFFVWESGLFDVIRQKLDRIAGEKMFQRLVERLTQFAVAKVKEGAGEIAGHLELDDLDQVQTEIAAITREPYQDLDPAQIGLAELTEEQRRQLEEEIGQDGVIGQQAEGILNSISQGPEGARSVGCPEAVETQMSASVLEELRREPGQPVETGLQSTIFFVKKAVNILRRVLKRYSGQRHHGIYPTIAEEVLRELYIEKIGKSAWNTMKRDTRDAFGNDPDVFVGTAFLKGLADLRATRPLKVTLVGHSAGAIYVMNFLRQADEVLPPDVRFDIVLLAPACDFKLFAATLRMVPGRIANLRIFAMSDERETRDRMLSAFYPRSLLYFVSGLLEDEVDKPIVGMQRFYTGAEPFDANAYPEIAAVMSHLSGITNGQVWSVQDSPVGCVTAAKKHGDFDCDPGTIASLSHLLSNGY